MLCLIPGKTQQETALQYHTIFLFLTGHYFNNFKILTVTDKTIQIPGATINDQLNYYQ